MNGLTRLRVGDVLRVMGVESIVDMVNASRARCVPLRKITRTVKPLVGEPRTFTVVGEPESISTMIEPGEIIKRTGREGLADFLASGKAALRLVGDNNGAEGKEEAGMKRVKAGSKDNKAPAEHKERTGGLGEWKGHSIGSVIKRLGTADVSAAWALEIMKALGVDKRAASAETFRNTVAWNVTAGKSGRGKVAMLSKAEVDELKALAPEPKDEPKSAKPAKKGKAKAKAKGGRKPKAAAAEPMTEAGSDVSTTEEPATAAA